MTKKRKGGGLTTFFSTLLLVVAIGVFCFAAWKLYGYWRAYKVGEDEYKNLNEQYVLGPENVPLPEGSSAAGTPGDETSSESAAPQAALTPVSSAGIILPDVQELENPDTLAEKVAQAATEDTMESGERKKLPLLRNPINFTELNAINPEVIGWIRIGALDVSYPIAQAKDNDFYLHRTFEKQDNFAGCIFLNCDNSRFFTDQNSIVYGHNMKNGSMFGTLSKFRSQETYDSNPYFWIFTPTLIYQYRIFSCSEVAAEGAPYMTRFTTEGFREFLNNMAAQSAVRTNVSLSTDDRVTTLSTCTGNSATRFIVQGKLEQMYIAK